MIIVLVLITVTYLFGALIVIIDIFVANNCLTNYGKRFWLLIGLFLPIIGAILYFWVNQQRVVNRKNSKGYKTFFRHRRNEA